jgi:hypothetical protein
MSGVVIEGNGSAQRKPTTNTAVAVESVPVEVWHKVLRITISCPLIPREDDDYFQRRDVADFGCAKIYQYVKSEQIRTKLRLVCRSWDAFLSEHSDRLVHLSSVMPGGHWPPVKKWDRVIKLVGPRSLTCKCVICPLTGHFRQSMYRRWDGASAGNGSIEDQIRGEYLPLISSRCRVIIMPYIWKNDLLDSERFGSVTMLTEELKDPTTQLPIISATYHRLTHLDVTLLSPFNLSLGLHLPRLTTLTVCVRNPGLVGAEEPAIVGRWILPKLRHLTFAGPFPEAAIYSLLNQVGLNVTEFHLQDETLTSDVMALSRIWSFLPSVSLFGAFCLRLLSLSPPVDRHNRPINLILHFDEGQRYCMPETTSLTLFQQHWVSLIAGPVIIDISWREWIGISAGFPQFSASALSAQIRLFDLLDGMGCGGLCDREGVLFGLTIKEQLSAIVEKLRHSTGLGRDPMVCSLSAGA